jgi:hypothetical protein
VVTKPGAEQVHREKDEQLNNNYGLAFDYEQPDRMLAESARQEAITLLQLMPAFRNFHLKIGTFLHGFASVITGHWNEHVHRLAADEIYKFLTEKRLVSLNGKT